MAEQGWQAGFRAIQLTVRQLAQAQVGVGLGEVWLQGQVLGGAERSQKVPVTMVLAEQGAHPSMGQGQAPDPDARLQSRSRSTYLTDGDKKLIRKLIRKDLW